MKYLVYLLLGCSLLGCAAGQAGRGGKQVSASGVQAGTSPCECPCAKQTEQAKPSAPDPSAAASDHSAAAVPVLAQDPTWGNPDALVTIVEFSDFQCPFCSHVLETLEELKRSYGPDQIRLVWKHFPLSFHVHARPAAEAAATAFALGGSQPFWRFHDLLFANQGALDPGEFSTWAEKAGLSPGECPAFSAGRGRGKVDDDLALGGRLQVLGTPSFLINGASLGGAQPIEKFKEVIDGQLAAAKALLASGLPAHAVYPTLCAKNVGTERAKPRGEAEEDDATVWGVPVEQNDPVRGPADALVTIVVFSDFQCPFCQRLDATFARLRGKYGPELRIVWKDHPLPFHEHALPAAVLARVALDKKGLDGFWKAHDAIFAAQTDLSPRSLGKIAKQLGVKFGDVERALVDRRYQPVLDASEALANAFGAQGTPTSFVNGHRMVGAQPFEKFVAVVESELARAKAMVEAGEPRAGLYRAMVKAGKEPAGPERRKVEEP